MPGAFDQALALTGEQVVLKTKGTFLAEEWTLEFWLRLEAAPGRMGLNIMRLPGHLRLRVQPDGKLRAIVETDPEQAILSKEPVPIGEWVHVGASLNTEYVHQLRLVVGDKVSGRRLKGGIPEGPAKQLRIGDKKESPLLAVADLSVRWYASTSDEMLYRGAVQNRYGFASTGPGGSAVKWNGVLSGKRVQSENWLNGDLTHVRVGERGLERASWHWTRIDAEPAPLARTTHPTIYLGDNRVWMYGGETRDSHLPPMFNTDDTWILHTDTNTWERIFTEKSPPPRCHQAAAYSPDHGVIFIAGGYVNEYGTKELLGDVWLYDVEKRQWIERRPVPALSDSGVVYHPGLKKFLLVRGRQIATYDPLTDVWEGLQIRFVTESGEPSDYSPGTSTIASLDPTTNKVLLFGGAHHVDGQVTYFNDTAVLDVEAETVTELDLSLKPSPRVRSGVAYDTKRQRFVFFGGVQDQHSEREADLWAFDMKAKKWSREVSSGTPTPRGGYYGMAYDPDIERFILLCGRHSRSHFLNDAWALGYEPEAPGTATYVFDRTTWTGAGEWSLEAETPEGTAVGVRFQGSDDLATWSELSGPEAVLASGQRYVMVELSLRPSATGASPSVREFGF